jgi:small subunit ribosomal protein S16
MAVKLRLQRHGSKKRPFYFIVAAHQTVTRDGNFIEKVGTYNPLTVPATIEMNRERAYYWLSNGAIPTNTVDRILTFKGVKFYKHLMRGVKLGLFDQAAAEAKFEKWIEEHDKSVADKKEKHKTAKAEIRIAQQAPVKKVEEAAPVIEETPVVEETPVEEAAPVAEEVAVEAEAPVAEAPAAEAAPEASAKEETPAAE